MPSVPRPETNVPARGRLFPELGLGLGLRPDHYGEVLGGRASGPDGVSWFEVVSENFMRDGGRPLAVLEQVRRDFPVVLHGVSLSIASTDPLRRDYLKRLKRLIDFCEPAMVSDHCCFTGVNGRNLHDLCPVPFTEEAIRHIAARVSRVQDFLGRRILLENVSSYITFAHSEMTEWEFLAEIARRADCGLLLDVNNVYVSAVNHGFRAEDYLAGIPVERVGQIHLAGHSTHVTHDGRKYLIDTHDHPVCPEVWELYAKTVERFGSVPTMIEWDAEIPSFDRLLEEIGKAGTVRRNILNEKSPHSRKVHREDTRQRPRSESAQPGRDAKLAGVDHLGA